MYGKVVGQIYTVYSFTTWHERYSSWNMQGRQLVQYCYALSLSHVSLSRTCVGRFCKVCRIFNDFVETNFIILTILFRSGMNIYRIKVKHFCEISGSHDGEYEV
jgi:hypothetical protein